MVDDFYREEILDHSQSSPYRGRLDRPDLVADGVNPLCGDRIHLELGLAPDGTIGAVRFDGSGCAISQASASMLAEQLEGKSADEARRFDRQAMLDLLGIPLTPARQKCCLLAWKTLQKALESASSTPAPTADVPAPCPRH
ncbi:MAG: iron-sulfur cluster assembly scaffold protein [Isosphaeraceae bacterium]|jgi:nitrogen fixation NifU-like protein|nr:MAG: iron-sulfur cluster assembly scaffold protein [Isosphaeraceae bacterium]